MSGDAALWAAEQIKDMFKAPHPVSKAVPSPRVHDLDIKAIMAEAWIRSGRRTLPPPLGLMPPPEAPDKRNVVLQVLEKSGAISATGGKPKVDDSPVSVPDPTNWDPLDMAWDTALDAVRERQRTESCSSGGGSCSSSGKHHRSSSHSWDETNPKKGRQMPTGNWNRLAPTTATPTLTLNWGLDILEPRGPAWKPVSGDALATPHHTVKSVVKPAPLQLASCGKGRGQILREK